MIDLDKFQDSFSWRIITDCGSFDKSDGFPLRSIINPMKFFVLYGNKIMDGYILNGEEPVFYFTVIGRFSDKMIKERVILTYGVGENLKKIEG
jgi:hypothetical protein